VVRPGVWRKQAQVTVDPKTQPGKALTGLVELCEVEGEPSDDFPGVPPAAAWSLGRVAMHVSPG
jgi:hypothetical protein